MRSPISVALASLLSADLANTVRCVCLNAQAVNEESFQHLMAFLDNLEALEAQAHSSPQNMSYPITFFIKDEHSSALVDGSAGSIQGLKKMQITLESVNYKQSLPAMRRSLGRLFDACDVEHSMQKLSEQPTISPTRYVEIAPT